MDVQYFSNFIRVNFYAWEKWLFVFIQTVVWDNVIHLMALLPDYRFSIIIRTKYAISRISLNRLILLSAMNNSFFSVAIMKCSSWRSVTIFQAVCRWWDRNITRWCNALNHFNPDNPLWISLNDIKFSWRSVVIFSVLFSASKWAKNDLILIPIKRNILLQLYNRNNSFHTLNIFSYDSKVLSAYEIWLSKRYFWIDYHHLNTVLTWYAPYYQQPLKGANVIHWKSIHIILSYSTQQLARSYSKIPLGWKR